MCAKIKGIYFTLVNEQRRKNGVPLCFTGLVKGTASSQALCPSASEGHVRVPGKPKGWHFQEGGKEEPGTKQTSCHSEGTCAHWSHTLVIICFVFPPILLLNVISLMFSPALCDCIAYSCGSWLRLFRGEDLYFPGITFCPEIPKLTPGSARKASLLGLCICLSSSWLVTVISNPIT